MKDLLNDKDSEERWKDWCDRELPTGLREFMAHEMKRPEPIGPSTREFITNITNQYCYEMERRARMRLEEKKLWGKKGLDAPYEAK